MEIIPNIPSIDDAEWNSALGQIQQPFLRLGKFDDAIETQILSLQGHWTTILHWVIRKKWKRKHRIPGDTNDAKGYEPLGELYFRILELCIQVHPFSPSGYFSAAHWFSSIVRHDRDENYRMIFAVASGGRKPPTKTELIKDLTETKIALNRFRYPYDPQVFINPYDPVADPHMHKLVAASVQYAESSDIFRNHYWKPYVTAFDAWVKEFSNPIWNIRYSSDGKLYHTTGKGKNRGITLRHLSDECLQSLHKDGSMPNSKE